MKEFFLVFTGGGIGSVLRYAIGKIIPINSFPIHTLVANAVSCVIFSIILVFVPNKDLRLLFITGLCGGLSTFSTFSYENYELIKTQQYLTVGVYISVSIVSCIAIFIVFYKVFAK